MIQPAIAFRQAPSSVFIIHPSPIESIMNSYGAVWEPHYSRALEKLKSHFYPVVILTVSNPWSDLLDFLKDLNNHSETAEYSCRYILVYDSSLSFQDLASVLQKISVFAIVSSEKMEELDGMLSEALQADLLQKQDLQLLHTLQDQNRNLNTLLAELEARAQKREQILNLNRARQKEIRERLNDLNACLTLIHTSSSVAEMELKISKNLKSLAISQTQISYLWQRSTKILHSAEQEVYQVPLIHLQNQIGDIHFVRSHSKPFTNDEKSLLDQVAEVATLVLERLSSVENATELKQQWELTFNAIDEPVSIISQNYDVLRANQAFYEFQSTPLNQQVTSRPGKCYFLLFGRNSPCPNCKLNSSFRLSVPRDQSILVLDVSSQMLAQQSFSRQKAFVHFYRNISNQEAIERKILESAQTAEVGVISSSIAHELNNPLGGMIGFLQLIKQDTDPSNLTDNKHNEIYSDILAMEAGAQRCKILIQNLLEFTRQNQSALLGRQETRDGQYQTVRPHPGENSDLICLNESVELAIQMADLKSLIQNVSIDARLPAVKCWVNGDSALLSQAFHEIIDRLLIKNEIVTGRRLIVRLHISPLYFQVRLFCPHRSVTQATGPKEGTTLNEKSLESLVAKQIISQCGGKVRVTASPSRGKVVCVLLPRPDFVD